MEKKKLWFRRKWYGWGWYPISIEGWLVTFVYIALIIFFGLSIDENSPPEEIAFTFLLPVSALTMILIRIAYRTGEEPRWQWGRPRKKEKDSSS